MNKHLHAARVRVKCKKGAAMRIIFMGTPEFAVPSLEKLCETNHEIVAVYTRADSKSGRGNKLFPSAIKQCAIEHDIEVFTPKTLRDEGEQKNLADLKPDIIVVAAYGLILPKEVLEIPRLGCINVHGSLLPRWRGAAPIQRALLAGDVEAGVCIMQMEEGLDTGNFHEAGRTLIGKKSADELMAEVAQLGADALPEAIDAIDAGIYLWQEQDESQVTYAEKIDKSETLLDPFFTVAQLFRRIQASSKRAPARCVVCGKEIAVCKADLASDFLKAGEVKLEKKRIVLGASTGSIELLIVKPQGKSEMPAQNWLAGLRTQDLTWHAI